MNEQHPSEAISRVKCDVKNCAHNEACHCTAKEIRVSPQHACCSGDTCCATFKLQG